MSMIAEIYICDRVSKCLTITRCHYFTAVIRIEPILLINATLFLIFESVIKYLLEALNLLVLDLQSDVNCLDIQVADEYREDFQNIFIDYKIQAYSLRTLCNYSSGKKSF